MPEDSVLFQRFGRTVESGEFVFREGEEGEQMYIVQQGRVRVSKKIGGRDHELAEIGPGEFFGEMAIVTKSRRTASIQAIEKTELLCFNREGFLSMINKNPMIALNIIDRQCRRVQDLHLQIQHFAKRDARGLVALNLLLAYNRTGAECLPKAQTVREISLKLQLPLEDVEKYVMGMSKKGIFAVDDDTLCLSDRGKLDQIVENVYQK
jgi:CRP/FNR family cyclic AMP-dependent transcriptional regulator